MKKLGKKTDSIEMTIEAYAKACYCSCSGTCTWQCKTSSSSKSSMNILMTNHFSTNENYANRSPIK